MYLLFSLVLCFASPLLAELNLHECGVSVHLRMITNMQHELTLISPNGSTIIKPSQSHTTNIKITEKPIDIKGWALPKKPNSPTKTKVSIKQIDNLHIQATFFYTKDFNKQIMPSQVVQLSFRYADLPLVYANSVVGHLDMIFYKTQNAIDVRIDEHDKGQLSIQRSGPWIGAFKHANIEEAWKCMRVKKVQNSQGKVIYEALQKGAKASDEKVLTDLITNKKVEKVDVNYKNKELTLIIK